MKQGTANQHIVDGAKAVAPKSKSVSLAAVSDLGAHQVRTKSVKLYDGRGYEAPVANRQSHPRGSQGKH
jgi:hypothetical protein